MQTFLEYTQPLRPDQFPTIRAFDTRGSLPKLLDKLNAALAAGSIPNPEYVWVKDTANWLIEGALKTPEHVLDTALRGNVGRTFTLHDLYGGIVYANTLPGRLKKAETATPQSDADKTFLAWLVPVLRELLPLANAVVSLKDKAVKRQPKTAEQKAAEKQRYIAPMAKLESGQAVTKVLTDLTNELKGDYAKAVAGWFVTDAEAYAALDAKTQRDKRPYYGSVLGISGVWKRTDNYYDAMTLTPTYKAACTKEAARVADDMQQQFVYKNSKKLVSILETKGIGLSKEPKILHAQAGRGVFEGDIRIEFADGSGFSVRNQIVVKRNNYGTVFNQYPTTFHDVTLPDGKAMASPSEERMNTVFAVTK